MGALGGVGVTFMAIRRRFSQDSTAIAADKAETSLISTLIAERDVAMRNAKEAWEQRIEDARSIARFEALDEAREREIKYLREQVFTMHLHIEKLTMMLMKIDPEGAKLLQLRPADVATPGKGA